MPSLQLRGSPGMFVRRVYVASSLPFFVLVLPEGFRVCSTKPITKQSEPDSIIPNPTMTILQRLSSVRGTARMMLARGTATNRFATVAVVRHLSAVASWSGILSFSSPESDFSSGAVRQREEFSGSLSFASPETDFCSGSLLNKEPAEWSHKLSFTSPEADFYTSSSSEKQHGPATTWSQALSFASPEADYTARVDVNLEKEWSHGLSFATPDADFVSAKTDVQYSKQDYINHVQKKEYLRPSMAFAWNLASAESDFASLGIQNIANDRIKQEMLKEEKQLIVDKHQLPLPTSLQEAEFDSRAIVITKAQTPFEIVDVNDAWVGLCGYSKEEARHHSVGSLLKGPETNQDALTHMLDDLLHGKEATTVITNYTKSGRKFHNKLRVGPLKDVHNEITHFVGVLQEVHDLQDHFVVSNNKKQVAA